MAVTQMVAQLTALAKLVVVDTRINLVRRSLQPRLKRLILQLSLKDHRRNIPAFGYIAPIGCFNSFRNVKDGVANPVLLENLLRI